MKNYIIARKQEKALVFFNGDRLLMVRTEPKQKVYLSTLDGLSGILHDDVRVFAYVDITKSGTQYALFDRKTQKYFCSKPLEEGENSTSFVANRTSIKGWELFDFIEEPEAVVPEFLSNSLMHFIDDYSEKSINLYWWRGKDFINFGDEINPHLVSFMTGKKIRRVEMRETELIGVGSILDAARQRDKAYRVWGSGTLSPLELDPSLYRLSLLRGPLTHSLLGSSQVLPYGDPGLICSRVWEASPKKKYDWGLLVHHSQYHKPWVQKLIQNTPKILFIDVKNENIAEIMDQISSCKAIASTSLHGLIIADSYKIPNVWLWDNNLHRGGQWKFFDYFAGVGRTLVDHVDPNSLESLKDIKKSSSQYKYLSKVDAVCDRIMSAFPL